MAQQKLILGIETSCDETAASVVSFNGKVLSVLSNAVASQIPIHRLTGGVVPEVAAREHVTTIVPTIKLALSKAKLAKEDLDAVAVTAGPGLLPALMVGVDTANALSLALGIPVIPVQHISGHIYANFLSGAKNSIDTNKVKF
ncbi:MAG TPA: tRNA (adenosine(37)-N6)-threonylcarbamoyltransferase complex transferase subunit TsaD, partial [Flavobacterium sp.]|nr:tRNA (adenosine(37)-N6)-threonylcarbamoyltransferase complex transferase subunit TsaD [Flavobacterium sp.]